MRERIRKFRNTLTQRYNDWREQRYTEGGSGINCCCRGEIVIKDDFKSEQKQASGPVNAKTTGIPVKKLGQSRPIHNYCCRWRYCGSSDSRRGLGLFWWAVLLLVVAYFVPDLPERMPTVYGLVDLVVSFSEWLFKVAFGGIYALFTGGWREFTSQFWASIGDGWQLFVEFLRGISL